ncbi:MAG: hypothetical protein M1834_008783 [Cirrosporium novae-zelandiae]|nr:MAG: hypothetical protein M1834_008783 [Cirrosporium novae-zelandiae]
MEDGRVAVETKDKEAFIRERVFTPPPESPEPRLSIGGVFAQQLSEKTVRKALYVQNTNKTLGYNGI